MTQLTRPNVVKIFKQLSSNGTIHPCELLSPRFIDLDWLEFANSFTDTIDPSHDWGGLVLPFDLILCTDCVFSKEASDSLIKSINICSSSRTVVYCCYEIRDVDTNNHFLREFEKNFHVKTVPGSDLNPAFRSSLVRIIIGKRRRT